MSCAQSPFCRHRYTDFDTAAFLSIRLSVHDNEPDAACHHTPLRCKGCSCTEHVGGEIQSAEVIFNGFGAADQFNRPVTA